MNISASDIYLSNGQLMKLLPDYFVPATGASQEDIRRHLIESMLERLTANPRTGAIQTHVMRGGERVDLVLQPFNSGGICFEVVPAPREVRPPSRMSQALDEMQTILGQFDRKEGEFSGPHYTIGALQAWVEYGRRDFAEVLES